jgi:hypothetical protein
VTRLAKHLRLCTDGDLRWRFTEALYFANQELVSSFSRKQTK